MPWNRDWAKVAATVFRVGFSSLRELPPDDKGQQSVARRAHEAAYSLMAGSPDSNTPYTADGLEQSPYKSPFAPDAELHSELGLDR
jgi:hypothetical protein